MVNPKYLAKLAEEQKEAVDAVVAGLAELRQVITALDEKVTALGRMMKELRDGSEPVRRA